MRLGTRHGIVTRYTSGLVVEDRPIAFRGPSGGVPPALREPSEPEPPPPPAMPPGPTTPARPALSPMYYSSKLAELKKSTVVQQTGSFKAVADKTFRRDESGRWVDTTWKGKGETTKIEAFSTAYFDLLKKNEKIAKYLAVGTKVIFTFEGTTYEVG